MIGLISPYSTIFFSTLIYSWSDGMNGTKHAQNAKDDEINDQFIYRLCATILVAFMNCHL